MSNAIIYARSAGSSAQQVHRQRKLCRSYLREVGLTEVGFVSEYGHAGPGLSESSTQQPARVPLRLLCVTSPVWGARLW